MTEDIAQENDFDKVLVMVPKILHEAFAELTKMRRRLPGTVMTVARSIEHDGSVMPCQTLHGNLPLSFRQGGVPAFPVPERHAGEIDLSHR